MALPTHILDDLAAEIATRAQQLHINDDTATHSYTANLLKVGREKILRKLGEETLEVVLAGALPSSDPQQQQQHIIAESADLLYHLLVLWQDADITPDQVWQTLAQRRGVSGLVEKASRPSSSHTRITKKVREDEL